jgi:hypothetical protein
MEGAFDHVSFIKIRSILFGGGFNVVLFTVREFFSWVSVFTGHRCVGVSASFRDDLAGLSAGGTAGSGGDRLYFQ